MARLSTPATRLAFLLLALVAGCGGKPPPGKYPELSWAHLPPLKLLVDKIEIAREYQPRLVSPHVETLSPRTLVDSAERWARDRLVADGDEGYARFVITDASLVEAQAASRESRRYLGHVAVRIEIHDEHGAIIGQAAAEASHTESVAREVSDNDLRESWYLIVQGTMLDLNAELERSIRFYLSRFVEQ